MTTTARTFRLEAIALRDLRHLDLRHEAAEHLTTHRPLGRDDVDDTLWSTSTEEPFAAHPALAYRIWIDDENTAAEALVTTGGTNVYASRVGLAWGADATWGDLMGPTEPLDITTEAGGDRFAEALADAVEDWLNDPEAWEARA